MKNLKRLTAIVLVLALFALAGCSGGGNSSANNSSSSSLSAAENASTGEVYKIGLVQYVEHTSLDMIREAFLSRLDEWGYDETKVSVDYKNASGDTSTLNTICQQFVGDEVDMIVAIATPAAQTAISATEGTDIKVVFSAVNNPESDLGIANTDASEGNVTGTSDRIPVAKNIDLALSVNPNMKTLGLLYNSGESNSVAAVEEAKAYCAEIGISVEEGAVSNTSEIQQVATDLCTKVDAIFTSTDNSVASAMAVVAESTRSAKIPYYVGADSMVMDGALASYGIDYNDLGAKNADMVVEIIEGKAISEVPVYFYEEYELYINQTTLDAVGVTFPEEAAASATFFN